MLQGARGLRCASRPNGEGIIFVEHEHPIPDQTLTRSGGPVVTSVKTLSALTDIRRDKLLPQLYGRVAIARTNLLEMSDRYGSTGRPAWLDVMDDRADIVLPQRCQYATPSEAATLRLAIGAGASLVLLDGPIKDKAKFSFIKSEGTVSILVMAYRGGLLSAVPPMVKALEKLGHADVLPPPDMLDALWQAIDQLDG